MQEAHCIFLPKKLFWYTCIFNLMAKKYLKSNLGLLQLIFMLSAYKPCKTYSPTAAQNRCGQFSIWWLQRLNKKFVMQIYFGTWTIKILISIKIPQYLQTIIVKAMVPYMSISLMCCQCWQLNDRNDLRVSKSSNFTEYSDETIWKLMFQNGYAPNLLS